MIDIHKLTFKEAKDIVRLNTRFLGFSALANFGDGASSSRFVMFHGFLSQYVPLENSEPKIILSGLEREFGKTFFNKKIENDSALLGIVERYDSLASSIKAKVEKVIFIYDGSYDELDIIDIPKYEKHSPKFGFNLKETDVLDDLEYGDQLEADTILARVPSDKGNDDIGVGVNAIGALVTDKKIGEDAVIISESFAEKCSFNTWATFKLSTGINTIPLNIFGDLDNYKVMKDIDETLEDTVFFATRNAKVGEHQTLYASLFSDEHLMSYDVNFDNMYNVNKAGGVIEDIKVIRTPKGKRVSAYTGIYEQLDLYADAYELYMKEFIRTLDRIKKQYPDTRLSRKLHHRSVYYRSLLDPRVSNFKDRNPLDLYHIEITVRFKHKLTKGKKVTGLYGNKGIVADVIPDEDMPLTPYGKRVEYLMDGKSVSGRMNPAVTIDGTMGNVSRQLKYKYIDLLKSNGVNLNNIYTNAKTHRELFIKIHREIIELFDLLELEVISEIFKSDTYEEVLELIQTIVSKELYIPIEMASKISKEEMIKRIANSKFMPKIERLTYKIGNKITTTDTPVETIVSYMLVLSKIGDTWLATSTGKVNHYGIPISTSRENRVRQPYTPNPVRTGEAESRLIGAYCGPLAMAELRNRSVSTVTHTHVYERILTDNDPANIKQLIDRKTFGYPSDKPVEILRRVIQVGSIDFKFKEDLKDINEKDDSK